jgi:hypothetical protein
VDKDKYKGVDRNKLLAELKEKYADIPEPGTQEWLDFLTRLKEESPDDYRKALLLGGGVTAALQKEIQRSKRRDAVQGFLNRLLFRKHQGKSVPDKRKIGLLIFFVVGGLFIFAFFVGTSPKKEATGGGLVKGVPTAQQKVEGTGEPPTVSASPSSGSKASGSEAGTGSSAGSSDSTSLASILSSASSSTGSSASAGSSTSSSPTGGASSSPTPPAPAQNVPPPPPPVYGTGSSVPPPPDTSYSAGNQSGQGGVVYPPPMVLYADPGMPVGPTPNSPYTASTTNTAPSTPPPSEPTNTSEPRGGMLFITNQPSSMTIVSGQGQSGMAVSESGSAQANPSPSTPQSPYPPGTPMPYPNVPGGGQP